MKSIKSLILTVAIALVACSCSTVKTAYYTPGQTQLNISMDNLNYLGDVELSVQYDTYLGIFKKINEINGVPYDGKVVRSATVPYSGFSFKYQILNRAAPLITETYPDADYMIICNQTVESNILFLGGERLVKAKVKVYSFKK